MYPQISNSKLKIAWVQFIVCTIFMIAMAIVFYFLIVAPVPIVKISASTGNCVSVEIEGKDYDCSCFKDLKKYEIMHVK